MSGCCGELLGRLPGQCWPTCGWTPGTMTIASWSSPPVLGERLSTWVIGKDAAAQALRRLIGAGVLCRRPQGNDAAGRFAQSTYELHLAHPAPGPPRPADPDTVDHPCTGPADTEGDDPAPVSASSGTGNRRRSPSGEAAAPVEPWPPSCPSST